MGMFVNYPDQYIAKPAGKRTPASRIPFGTVKQYMQIFQEVVDVQTATKAVDAWVRAGYPEEQVMGVLHAVIIQFGGGYRIWGRYHALYTAATSEINTVLREAHLRREESVGTLRGILKNIKGLGSLSYSTKMLRFLNPHYVVLDSVLQDELGLSEADYHAFASHCRRIAETLGVNPVDVESGLFAYVQIANPNQRQKAWRAYQGN